MNSIWLARGLVRCFCYAHYLLHLLEQSQSCHLGRAVVDRGAELQAVGLEAKLAAHCDVDGLYWQRYPANKEEDCSLRRAWEP